MDDITPRGHVVKFAIEESFLRADTMKRLEALEKMINLGLIDVEEAKEIDVCALSAMAQICQFDLEQSFLALQMSKGSNGDFSVASFMSFYWGEMANKINRDIELIRWQGDPTSENYPSAGVVAHLLWGSGPSKSSANRAMKYAQGVVARLEEENRASISQESEQMAKIEKRTNEVQFELRAVEGGDGMTFTGYAAVFNSPSEPLPFIERIAPGAFKRSLKARNDIKLLFNHDTGAVLGSTRAGTLKLEEDNYGLRVTAILPPTTLGNDVKVLVQRGDLSAMSFGFSVPANGDSWNTDGTERTLKSVRIHEVSIVAFPAYSQTAGTAAVRSFDGVAKRAEVDADQLADAMLAIEDGKDLSLEQSELLTKVIQRLTPQEEAEAEANSEELTALELKKKKFELLMKRL